ncbi:hypothetical protein SLA2020_493950 [Shorea laevis]
MDAHQLSDLSSKLTPSKSEDPESPKSKPSKACLTVESNQKTSLPCGGPLTQTCNSAATPSFLWGASPPIHESLQPHVRLLLPLLGAPMVTKPEV